MCSVAHNRIYVLFRSFFSHVLCTINGPVNEAEDDDDDNDDVDDDYDDEGLAHVHARPRRRTIIKFVLRQEPRVWIARCKSIKRNPRIHSTSANGRENLLVCTL